MATKRTTPDQHLDAAKRRLVHLHGLAAKTAETERRILSAAEHRLEAVRADLEKLRPRVNLDSAAADQYQSLTLERGKLELVIGRARKALGE